MNFIQKFVGRCISKIIMHSQLFPKYDFDTIEHWQEFCKSWNMDVNIQRMSIDSTSGAKLDLCEIYCNTNLTRHNKVIIYAMAAGDMYERHLKEYIFLAKQFPNYKIICFNFRNVQTSAGAVCSEEDWIEDAIAVIEKYRNQKYALPDILIAGHSLGGAIATKAAERIYSQECLHNANEEPLKNSVKLINERSFSTLTNEILHSFLRGPGSGLVSGFIYGSLSYTILGRTVATGVGASLLGLGFLYPKIPKLLLKPWIKFFITHSFGNLDGLSAFKTLPEGAKDYIVAENDFVIDKLASLHHELKTSNTEKKNSIRSEIEQYNNVDEAHVRRLNEELLNMKDSKLYYDPPNGTRIADGFLSHFLPLNALSTNHKMRLNAYPLEQVSGEEVMVRKIQRLFSR
jgi:hypothetical protein